MAGMTVLEYDVISVVHVSGDAGNHFSVLFCNLHRVEQSALVFSHKVLNICIDRHSLVRCKSLDDVFHPFGYCEIDSLIMLTPEIIFVFSSIHGTPLYFVDSVNQFLNLKMSVDNLCHALSFMPDNFLDDLV